MREAHERKSRNNGLYLAAANAHTCKFSHLILLPHCSIMKIHLLHPFHPCRLSPHRLRTPKTWCPRHPPGSPPSPQSNRWNISVQSCQISALLWTCGFRCLHLHPPLLQTGSVLLTHTHTLAPTCSNRSCGHTRTHTDRDASDLATVVGLLATPPSKSPPLLRPVTFPPSLCSFSRLLLGNYSAELSHIEQSVCVRLCATHSYLKPYLSCAGLYTQLRIINLLLV